MFDTLYMQILDMSKVASIVILAVLLIRLLLKKAPKTASYALWSIVLFRLLVPFSIEASVSLIPETTPTVESYELMHEPVSVLGAVDAAQQLVGDALNGGIGIQHVHTTEQNEYGNDRVISTDWENVMILVGKYVWIAGFVGLILYSTVSLVKLHRRLTGAIRLKGNIFLADHIDSPFVMGLFRPKIYLPSTLSDKEREYIILHEQHHIRRGDHIIKLLSFAALCLHCFNPLVWTAFILSGKDMEMSCDEAVIRKTGSHIRADYSASLLSLATGRRIIAGAPLAFGEGNTEGRIRNLAKWKKPALWVTVIAAVICVIAAVCLITNPMTKNTMLLGAEYRISETLYSIGENNYSDNDQPSVCITADYGLWEWHGDENGKWRWIGQLEPYALTEHELESYITEQGKWFKKYDIGEITDAYIHVSRLNDETFGETILVFQTKKGDTLFAFVEHNELNWLCRLKSTFGGTHLTGEFHERSLTHVVAGDVDIFHTWYNGNFPGYMVTGFMSDHGSYTPGVEIPSPGKTDMGFAVFCSNKKETGYRLIDCKVYPNAALAANGIYICKSPAILDRNGTMEKDNTFDVLFLNNERIAKVTQTVIDEKGTTKTQSHTVSNAPEMVLFPWKNRGNYSIVSYEFYDKNGDIIENSTFGANVTLVPTIGNAPVTPWLNQEIYSLEMDWDKVSETTIPEFPNTVFQISNSKISATVGGKTSDLIGGMPVWNAYFTDLNDDGYPELCASVSFGSGIVDNHIEVYDIKNGTKYTLWERMKNDYHLVYEDGQLFCVKVSYGSEREKTAGRLAIQGDSLVMLTSAVMTPTTADVTGAFDNYLFIPLNGANYRFERTTADPDSFTKGALLYSFTESVFDSSTEWRVYATEEYPDCSVIYAEADSSNGAMTESFTYICQYSPPKRVSPDRLAEAKESGKVVLEDGYATVGQNKWHDFYQKAQDGQPASIELIHYYTLDPEKCDKNYYEANKEDYPALYNHKLSFDGEKFTLGITDNGKTILRNYKYLKEFECFVPESPILSSGLPEKVTRYVLVNDDSAGWEDLTYGLISSQLGDYIDHFTIYSEK